jgi:molecular chaperone GrpE (heat shock protein)
MSEESDKGENVILREFEKGYNYNDKILRHAKVVVSKS